MALCSHTVRSSGVGARSRPGVAKIIRFGGAASAWSSSTMLYSSGMTASSSSLGSVGRVYNSRRGSGCATALLKRFN